MTRDELEISLNIIIPRAASIESEPGLELAHREIAMDHIRKIRENDAEQRAEIAELKATIVNGKELMSEALAVIEDKNIEIERLNKLIAEQRAKIIAETKRANNAENDAIRLSEELGMEDEEIARLRKIETAVRKYRLSQILPYNLTMNIEDCRKELDESLEAANETAD